jgi:uncharacterized protein YecT (DUF1311 family)
LHFLALRLTLAILLPACGGGVPHADSTSAIAADLRRAAASGDRDSTGTAVSTTGVPDASRATPAAGAPDSDWVLGATGVPHRVIGAAVVAPTAPPPLATAARDTGDDDTSWCASPRAADQQRCLTVYLASYDARLNRTYQSLVDALVRQAGTPTGAAEPQSVRRLRAAQRAWLQRRDAECRASGRITEGPLWAPSRARCLGDQATQREHELAAELRGLDSTGAR